MERDVLFQEYEEELARIDKWAHEARDETRTKLQEQLKILRETAHNELKAIRKIDQKIKRSSNPNR